MWALSVLVAFVLGATAALEYKRPADCADPFQVDEAGLNGPRWFLAADTSTVPITLRDPAESSRGQSSEPYFEAMYDSKSRLSIVTVHLEGQDHVLSYEYRGSEVIQHCRTFYRPPANRVPHPGGGSVR